MKFIDKYFLKLICKNGLLQPLILYAEIWISVQLNCISLEKCFSRFREKLIKDKKRKIRELDKKLEKLKNKEVKFPIKTNSEYPFCYCEINRTEHIKQTK